MNAPKPRQQDVHLPDIMQFVPGGQPLVIYDPQILPYGAIPADDATGDAFYGFWHIQEAREAHSTIQHGFAFAAPLYPQMPPGEIELAPFFQPPTIPDDTDAVHALEDYSIPIVCDDVSELLKAVMGDVEGMEEYETLEEDYECEKDEAMVEFLLTHEDSETDQEADDMDVQPVKEEGEEAHADA
ncbi:hypothetical protein C8Q70DRAFT_1121349 [Cubamyces menziesii]|nr:hypothetical protein C8Q70DRAFT_1121349 [Cubamyces menziesii]